MILLMGGGSDYFAVPRPSGFSLEGGQWYPGCGKALIVHNWMGCKVRLEMTSTYINEHMARVQTNPRKREKKFEKLRYSWSPQARYLIQLCTIETQEVITLTRTVESACACGIDKYLPLSKTRLSAFQFQNGVGRYGSVLNSRVPNFAAWNWRARNERCYQFMITKEDAGVRLSRRLLYTISIRLFILAASQIRIRRPVRSYALGTRIKVDAFSTSTINFSA